MPNSIGNSPFWFGYSLDFWNSVSSKLLVFAVLTGILAAAASGLSSWIGSAVTGRIQDAAGDRIGAAELELQKSRERTAALDVAVSEANARAAEANRTAEQERLARLKIEERLAFRVVTPAATAELAEAVSRFAGQSVDVFVAGENQETSGLAQHLASLLETAGWKPLVWSWTGVGGVVGVGVLTEENASPATLAAAVALSQALIQSGLVTARQVWPSPWKQFGGMLNGPTFDPARTQMRLVIGTKPQ